MSEPEPLKSEGPGVLPHTVALVLHGNDLLEVCVVPNLGDDFFSVGAQHEKRVKLDVS